MLRTYEQFLEGLSKMRPNVYVNGKLVDRLDPILMPMAKVIKTTFDAYTDPELKDLATTTSHLNGEPISRFSHVYQSVEDMLAKQAMIRKMAGRVGGCIARCMGCDMLNAMYVTTKEVDDACGTEYHERFKKYMDWYQRNDKVGNGAQTDVKGDRSKRPSEQADPDLYLRIVERREDGIVVSGCKAHNTVASCVDEILVAPTRAMTENDADWAVAFAVPADAEGVSLVCRVSNHRNRDELKSPFSELGWVDSMTVFDHVFVPWDRVFLCGEWQFAGRMALGFANNHRFSYCGCKPAVTDIFMGATSLVAEYNGVGKAPHIVDDVTVMMAQAELIYAAGIAAAHTSRVTSSGAVEPNFMYTNCGRYYAGINLFHEYDVLSAVAGGLPSTLPHEADFFADETKAYMDKYIMRNPKISAENQHRLFRFISDYSCSGWGGVMQYAGIHGGGSPIMEKIGIRSNYDLKSKQKLVKYLAGIED